jgi:hypothetical protein
MLTCTQLLAEIRDRDITMRVDGEKLLVAPKQAVTPEITDAIHNHKHVLVALIRLEQGFGPLDLVDDNPGQTANPGQLGPLPKRPVVTHPARWTPAILDAIEPVIVDLGLPVHDPFAGTGERLGALCDKVALPFTGTEIEAPFIIDPRVKQGDSSDPATYPPHPHVVVTSPVYPNGMADHFRARDTSKRHTYRQALATILGYDQPLHANNMGRYAGRTRRGMASERRHFDIARRCIVHWPDHVIVNVKDVITKTEVVPVVELWKELLVTRAYEVVDEIKVATPGQRNGANSDARADHEMVLVATL